jgi:hypothetical protein
MTKEQAQEYATRIRLGEPLCYLDEGPGAPLHFGFADGARMRVVCSFYLRRGLTTPWGFRPPVCQFVALPAQRDAGHMDTQHVLRMLDQRANAP